MRVLVGVGVGYVRGCMCVCVCASPHLGCSGMQTPCRWRERGDNFCKRVRGQIERVPIRGMKLIVKNRAEDIGDAGVRWGLVRLGAVVSAGNVDTAKHHCRRRRLQRAGAVPHERQVGTGRALRPCARAASGWVER